MKRNLIMLVAAGLLVAFAASLWATRGSDSGEPASPREEPFPLGTPSVLGVPERGAIEPALIGPVPEGDKSMQPPSSEPYAVTGEAGGGSPQVAGASIDRKVIQTASMSLSVKSVARAFQEVGRIAAASGGFVASSTFSNEGEEQVASITIRVPAVRFQDVLASLRGLAVEVESEQSEASDVTEEFSDLAARLRNLEATEAQYLEFLKRAKDIGEVLQVQDRLNAVRAEIEQVRGRMNLLDNLSELAVATVHLRPEGAPVPAPGPGGPDPVHAAQEAWQASLEALRGIASAIVVVAAFSWWLVPPLGLLALVVWRTLSRHARGQVEAR